MSENSCPYCAYNQNHLEVNPYDNRYTPLERQLLRDELEGTTTIDNSSQLLSDESTNDYNSNDMQYDDSVDRFERALEQRTLDAETMNFERDLFCEILEESTYTVQINDSSSQNTNSGILIDRNLFFINLFYFF